MTRTSTSPSAGSPTWSGPSAPLAWPPPTVTSRVCTGPPSPPVRTSTIAPIASGFVPAWWSGATIQRPSSAGALAVPPPTLRQTLTGFVRNTSTMSSRPSWLRSTTAAPRPRSNWSSPAAFVASLNVPSGCWSSSCDGSFARTRPAAPRCPWSGTGPRAPSLLTSSNAGCQAVDGNGSPPLTGLAAFTPAREGDVLVRRAGGAVHQRLQLVVRLGGQVDLRLAVAGEVDSSRCPCPR